ncbi:MAG: hypothetical protein KGQ52_13790 [Alphaproteobacteria bacterium]|nr:hypothetical protein [Alphaproteobacteria bacterium]
MPNARTIAPTSTEAAKPTYQPKRGVIVMAGDEADQQALYERLQAAGFGPLRVVTA